MRLTLHFDGSCWPNPGGLAKYGYTLASNHFLDASRHGFAGEGPSVSNNFAEFFALAEGLIHAYQVVYVHKYMETSVTNLMVRGDSEIAIKIMQGKYKANPDKLYYPQYSRCMGLLQKLLFHDVNVEFKWIPREQNTVCDELSKRPATKPLDSTLLAEAEALLL